MSTPKDYLLVELRTSLGLGQADMAKRMGISLRSYQEIEAGTRRLRSRHVRLAESVALEVAVENGDPQLAKGNERANAIKFAQLITHYNFRSKASKLNKVLFDED